MQAILTDQIERWPLERLIPHARNARTHSEEQVARDRGINVQAHSEDAIVGAMAAVATLRWFRRRSVAN